MKRILLSLLLAFPIIQVSAQCNVVKNGDFESGNTGFSSGYINNQVSVVNEGTYAVTTNPHSVHGGFVSTGDHTSGTGNMMVVNGSVTTGKIVWEQTVAVIPGANYDLSAWVQDVDGSPHASLVFSINGSQVGSTFSPAAFHAWEHFAATWNSGASTSAHLTIVDAQTAPGGNDFALDDISLVSNGPIITCPTDKTATAVANCCAVVTYDEPIALSDCQYCPQGAAISGYTYLGNYNGHDYYLSNSSNTWTNQNNAAMALGGHLAAIGSAGENTWVSNAAVSYAWIGYNDAATEGTFVWSNGETPSYSNWCTGEPNNVLYTADGEDYTTINWCTKTDGSAGWNDLDLNTILPAVVEFDCIKPVRTSGLPSGSCFPVGATTVTYTATDNNNNTATCSFNVTVSGDRPSCSISAAPTSGTYSDGNPRHIYLGYGNGKITLTASASGGSGFTYSWSGASGISCNNANCSSATFAPTAGGNYTITATVTNSIGCSSTCTIVICVLDIRVPGTNNNVYICHAPPGNPSNVQTLAVGYNAVSAHLGNHSGDRLGQCGQMCGVGAKMIGSNSIRDEVMVYPNPNNGAFTIELPYIEDQATITVTDVAGKTIVHRIVKDGDGNSQVFNLGDAAKGIYFVDVNLNNQRIRTKVTIQ
jgi:hypothetical protein